MPLNFVEIEVKYKTQAEEAGLRSDGELVQAVSEQSAGGGGGGGKTNVENLAVMKYVDTASDTLQFIPSAAPDADADEIAFLVYPSDPAIPAHEDDGLADTLVWQVGGSYSDIDTNAFDLWIA